MKAARSVTIQPFTASAGQVAHQLTTPTRRPFSDATFQNVLTLRSTALGGCGRVRRRRSVAAPSAEANGLLSGVEAHRRPQARYAPRVGRLDPVRLGAAAGGDRRPRDGGHALRLGPQPRVRSRGQERGQGRHLAAGEEVLDHAALQAVDRDDAHAQAGGHDRVVGSVRARRAGEPRREGHDAGEDGGGAEDEGQDAPPREARRRQVRGGAARREDGHGGEGGEAAQGQAQQEADRERGRLAEDRGTDEVRLPPQRDVGHGENRGPEADATGQPRPRLVAEPPGPGGEEAAGEGDHAREESEGGHQVDAQDQQVAGLGEEPPVEPRRRQGGRQAEQDAADEPHARGGPERGAQRGRAPRAAEDEAVEGAVEVAESPQFLAHRVDGGERRPVAAHQGRQRPLKR